MNAAQGLALPTASEDDAADLIATAALLHGMPVYRLQPPGPQFLACVGAGTRELADVAELRTFLAQIKGHRG